LLVAGEPDFVPRRVRDWLKAEARREIARRAEAHAEALGCRIRRITLRDTVSRWGSCSSDGRLSFSWRLMLAPAEVLEYVVAHEVAHLREMNHSAAFWRIVAQRCPYHAEARAWLKRHGAQLYRYA
ncbi:MAG: M48 family metallopeptidase, partial [Alphaproteobacteria bacterium]|nr:M48 family metallopeptidase [Alphaproteobacteria bacterium]